MPQDISSFSSAAASNTASTGQTFQPSYRPRSYETHCRARNNFRRCQQFFPSPATPRPPITTISDVTSSSSPPFPSLHSSVTFAALVLCRPLSPLQPSSSVTFAALVLCHLRPLSPLQPSSSVTFAALVLLQRLNYTFAALVLLQRLN